MSAPHQPVTPTDALSRYFYSSFLKKYALLLLLSAVLIVGFLSTSLISFYASRDAIRHSILQNELPLTTDNIYSEIQKDLIRPVFISSMMASDTFLRDWALAGAKQPQAVHKYLADIRQRSGVFTSFFVADASLRYYYGNGSSKTLSQKKWDDRWYFRVQKMSAPYELNVDHDLKLTHQLMVFVNHRMFDYQGKYMGVAGVGITVNDVQKLLDHYQRRYHRNVYFVDESAKIALSGDQKKPIGLNIATQAGLKNVVPMLNHRVNTSMEYEINNQHYLLNIRYVPELKWYLIVEKNEQDDTAAIRRTLYTNLIFCMAITLLVLCAVQLIVRRYQVKIERLSTLDRLTGLPNRAAFDAVAHVYRQDAIRQNTPIALLMFDIDFFKRINDAYGHLAGDYALVNVAQVLQKNRRASDFVCRWGGEEFLLMLKNCPLAEAVQIAETIRLDLAAQTVMYGDVGFKMTMSGGVAMLDAGETLEQWLSRADQHLYDGKRAGRNRVISD